MSLVPYSTSSQSTALSQSDYSVVVPPDSTQSGPHAKVNKSVIDYINSAAQGIHDDDDALRKAKLSEAMVKILTSPMVKFADKLICGIYDSILAPLEKECAERKSKLPIDSGLQNLERDVATYSRIVFDLIENQNILPSYAAENPFAGRFVTALEANVIKPLELKCQKVRESIDEDPQQWTALLKDEMELVHYNNVIEGIRDNYSPVYIG